MREFNALSWFGNRALNYVPKHFIKSQTNVTDESLDWVYTTLTGRFSVIQERPSTDDNTNSLSIIFSDVPRIYFEDSKEAMLYELRWSGTK